MKNFLESLNIIPKNMSLYEMAFTHPSFSNENRGSKSYERLEFLGDSVLGKLSAEYIYSISSRMDEGKMSILKNSAVSKAELSKHAEKLKLYKYIKVGNNGESLKKKDKVLEDVFEALIGAIYLDLGEAKVKEFLKRNVFEYIFRFRKKDLKDPKTLLQEFLQSESRDVIKYIIREIDKGFEAIVSHDGREFGIGFGKSKKEAETAAAKNALELLGR